MADRMTAEEIVRLSRYCARNEDNQCESCVLDIDNECYASCIGTLQIQAADLIENQGKEIESLKAKTKELEEKNLAKKVIHSEDNYYHFCNNCNKEIFRRDKYCHECGCKLDWSVENE